MEKDKLESRTGAESRSQITKGLVRNELKSKAPVLVAGEPSNTAEFIFTISNNRAIRCLPMF